MTVKSSLLALAALLCGSVCFAQRTETLLTDGWQFHKGEDADAWEEASIPHDWAIFGPFSRDNDLQKVAVTQNGETIATWKTGRTGGLPYEGVGVYRRSIEVPEAGRKFLLFDGAMSEAHVSVNGKEVCYWPYGYNSFYCDITDAVKTGENTLEVHLENLPQSSRWYPGAGLYRNVHLICTSDTYIPIWGTYITTPEVSSSKAKIRVETDVQGPLDGVTLRTEVIGPKGNVILVEEVEAEREVVQNLPLNSPELWSPENPACYTAVSTLIKDGKEIDSYRTVFGVRSVEITADKGFCLNGQTRKIKGVCNHHDLGPLGAAVNTAALRHQLELLKDMGCDAIRTSHNMPAPELVQLCNEMGFMMMIEPFDEWDVAKCENGYHRHFEAWAEKDMINMLRHYRNDPCVVMWSIGNEVPSQTAPGGIEVAKFLQDICHREDPTRLVTCGMDQVWSVIRNGFGAALDVPGLNYRTFMYKEAYEMLPQGFILGSETASAVSSRGVYHFPVERIFTENTPDNQCSSYDEGSCYWSNIADIDFALNDDYPWVIGQFVWTGFDYLGEPSPYDTDAWPSHSSYFGIIDLASLPKDRFYLYRSVWNPDSPTLHVLPHWTWPGREGEVTPVFVYTSYPSAELFVNGVSQGVQTKQTEFEPCDGDQKAEVEGRYRLIWKDVVYQPGKIEVVAYDANGNEAARQVVKTARKARRLRAEADRKTIVADGQDLSYITVSAADFRGVSCPTADDIVSVSVKGKGVRFRAIANGDPTSVESFQAPSMKMFSGKLTVIVQSTGEPGTAKIILKSKGLRRAKVRITAK